MFRWRDLLRAAKIRPRCAGGVVLRGREAQAIFVSLKYFEWRDVENGDLGYYQG